MIYINLIKNKYINLHILVNLKLIENHIFNNLKLF